MNVMGCVFKHVWGEHVSVDQRDRESSYLKMKYISSCELGAFAL